VTEAICKQIKILKDVNKTGIGYLDAIGNIEEIKSNEITTHQAWIIQQKSQYLMLSLHFAKENMSCWSWKKCCKTAVQQLRVASINSAKNSWTVQEWYQIF